MSSNERELSKDLGLMAALTIGIGTMIGAGIFVLPATVAANAGPAAGIAFIVAGFIALFTALSISELGTALPKAGGAYYYINDSLGPLLGSVAGWGNWLGLIFATAFYMIGFGSYLTILLPVPDFLFLSSSQVGALLAAIVFIMVNYYGTKETGRLQIVIVVILVGVLAIFSVVGLFHVDTANLRPVAPPELGGWAVVLPAAGLIFVTYLGFAEINTVAEELKDPDRNLPRAVIGSLLFVIALYALVMFVLMGVAPYETVVGYGERAVAMVAQTMMGWPGLILLTIGGLLATASSANASILASSRICFAMGRDKIITDWLNQIHRKFLTPYRSIAVTGGLILLFILIGDIELLAKAGSVLHLIVYGLLNIGLIVYRESQTTDYKPSFRVPFYPVVPVLGAILSFGLIGFMAPVEIILSLAFVIFGLLWYVFYAKRHVAPVSLVGEAIVHAATEPSEPLHAYRVVVPVANPETQRDLLRLAAASARTHAEVETPEIVAVNILEVPRQTSLEQKILFEEDRVERQRNLLRNAREAAEDLKVNIRTRAIVGRSAGKAILSVLKEEHADQIMLGWRGTRSRREHIFGSTLDPILKFAPCEVSLIRLKQETLGDVVALAGPGPHAPVAARRAYELAKLSGTTPTLLNVQRHPAESDEDPEDAGRQAILRVARAANLDPDSYKSEVLVSDNIRKTIMDTIDKYNTICVGMSTTSAVERILFGSLAEQIGKESKGNVILVRGPFRHHRTIRQAVAERLLRR